MEDVEARTYTIYECPGCGDVDIIDFRCTCESDADHDRVAEVEVVPLAALRAVEEERDLYRAALREAKAILGPKASSRTGRNPARGIEITAACWLQEHEAALAALSSGVRQEAEDNG